MLGSQEYMCLGVFGLYAHLQAQAAGKKVVRCSLASRLLCTSSCRVGLQREMKGRQRRLAMMLPKEQLHLRPWL